MKKLHYPVSVKTVLATLIGAGLSTPPLLQAQEENWILEEIVVTARKRQENIQDVGQSVSALNETEINRSMAKDLRDLAGFAPNLIVDDASSGPGSPASISLRGISFQDVEKSFDPAVGVVVDGVFMGTNTGQMFTVLDLERVEVLRGPQGTLFGKNSIGGVINIVRTKPTGEFGGKVRVRVGEYDLRNLDAVVNFPVTDQLAVKLTAASHEQGKGYFDNVTTGDNDGETEYQSLGVNLLFMPNDDMEVEYTFQREETEADSPPLVNVSQPGTVLCDVFLQCAESINEPQGGDRYTTFADGVNDAFIDIDSHIVEVRWAINDSVNFDYIFGLRESDEDIQQDFDASPVPFFLSERPQDYEQTSHEFRITYDGDGKNLVAGVYFWESEYQLEQTTTISGTPGVKITEQATDTWSVFFEGDMDLTESLILTVGGRYTTEEKESGNDLPAAGLLNLNNPESEQWSEFTPKLGLRYLISDDIMAYTTLSTGFRSGGFNGRPATAASALEPYDPETVENFEVGFKSDWLDSRLRFNAAYFYTNYDDKQEEVNRPAPLAPSGQETIVANAATAIIQGIELELQAYLVQGLKIRANLGLLDAEYDEFLADVNGDGNITDNADLDLRRTPEMTFSVDTSYEWGVGSGIAWVQASYRYTDEYETTFFNTPYTSVDAMSIVDASINYEINGYQFSLFGRNLTDENEWQHAFDVAGLFAFAAPRAPRTAGIEFSKTF